ncbi:hypothetical protein BKA70DRAFT_1428312 [Coprinopsis sp. MPI-PUGE-AT-0042]|nr:hypothetical protein BKA70DRAFT_1428312 [Coprinopsis sp. MPI-PUGE-AT-0042]
MPPVGRYSVPMDAADSTPYLSASPRVLRSQSTRVASTMRDPPLPITHARRLRIYSQENSASSASDANPVGTTISKHGPTTRVEESNASDRQASATAHEDPDLRRTRRALEGKKLLLRKTREDLRIAREELEESRGEVADLTERLEAAGVTKEQYRNWWINEVQFTKLILTKVPTPNQDWDLVRSSQSHYLGRF